VSESIVADANGATDGGSTETAGNVVLEATDASVGRSKGLGVVAGPTPPLLLGGKRAVGVTSGSVVGRMRAVGVRGGSVRVVGRRKGRVGVTAGPERGGVGVVTGPLDWRRAVGETGGGGDPEPPLLVRVGPSHQ